MPARNKVIAGAYRGKFVVNNFGGLTIGFFGMKLNRDTVESWEEVNQSSQISAASAVGRGLVGGALLGPVGVAAALSAKKKETHLVSVKFRNGQQSLLELDGKLYRKFIESVF